MKSDSPFDLCRGGRHFTADSEWMVIERLSGREITDVIEGSTETFPNWVTRQVRARNGELVIHDGTVVTETVRGLFTLRRRSVA